MEKGKITSYTEQAVGEDAKGLITYHSFNEAELKAYLEFINETLKDDIDIKDMLPITNDEGLVNIAKDGIMICKLINVAVPDTIDERTINRKKPLNVYQMTENLRLGINAAIAIGCHIINISPQSFLTGKLHLIMGMMWQILRIYLFKKINLKTTPEIICLALPGETMETVLKLNSEKILVRWLNYHLKAAKQSIVVKEIDEKLKDMVVFLHVLGQLDTSFNKASLESPDLKKRAADVLKGAHKQGVRSTINEDAMLQGNSKIYTMFCSLLFNANHGLHIEETKKKEVEKAALTDEAKSGTKEERTFLLWINSLNIEGVHLNELYEEIKDGLVILKVINNVWPGTVVNGKYEKNPGTNRFKMLANGEYISNLCKQKGLVTVSMRSSMLIESSPPLVLGLIWQLMRANYLQIIGGKTEEELVAWANKVVNKPPGIKSFKDPQLKTSLFLIDLMSNLEPGIVDRTLVNEAKTKEELTLNAKYCLSIARKMGAKIFLTWEDITLVTIDYRV